MLISQSVSQCYYKNSWISRCQLNQVKMPQTINCMLLFFSGFIFTSAQVVFITEMVTFISILLIHDSNLWFSYIHTRLFFICLFVFLHICSNKSNFEFSRLFTTKKTRKIGGNSLITFSNKTLPTGHLTPLLTNYLGWHSWWSTTGSLPVLLQLVFLLPKLCVAQFSHWRS